MTPYATPRRRFTPVAIAASLCLAACGGGGSNNDTAPPATAVAMLAGRVVDGYIRGAVVFWDCNKNGVLDADETSALSTAQGAYQIVDLSSKACPLLAYVGPTAVDEDRPLQLGSAYTMQAVSGRHDLITPFTTLVAGKVSSAGITVDAARAEVAAIFGFSQDILVDYKASNSAPLSAAAKDSVAALQTTQSAQANGLLTESAAKTFDLLKKKYDDSGFRAAIANGVSPFVASYQSLTTKLAQNMTGNDNNRLVRRVNYPLASQNSELNAIAIAVNAKSGSKYGYPNWSAFSSDELKGFSKTINKLNAIASDSPNSAKLQQLQQQRNDMFAAAGKRMDKEISGDSSLIGTWRFFTSDPGAGLDYAMESLAISGDIASDVVTLALPRPKVGRPTKLTDYKKKLASQLEFYSSFVSAGDCVVKVNKLEGSTEMATALVETVTACGGFLTEQLKDIVALTKTGATVSKGMAAAIDAAGATYGVIREEDKPLAAMKMQATTFALLHDMLELFAVDPVTSKLLAVLDLEIQFLNARVAAMELEKAAKVKQDDTLKAAIAKFDEEVAKTWRSYFISFMEIYGDSYFKVMDAGLCPTGQTLQVDGACALPADPGAPSFSLKLDSAGIAAVGGVAIGAPSYIVGKDGGTAMALTGGSRLRIPNRAALKVGAGMTVDVWAKATGAQIATVFAKSHDRNGIALMVAGTADGTSQVHLATFDPTWACTTTTSGNPTVETIQPIPLGTWLRLTAVIDPTNGYRLYLNKQLSKWCSGIKPSMAAMDAQDAYIGGFSDGFWPLTGAVQDLRVYPKALTAAEVAALP